MKQLIHINIDDGGSDSCSKYVEDCMLSLSFNMCSALIKAFNYYMQLFFEIS